MGSITAAYCRVSTTGQNEAGQVREIERWLCGNGIDDVRWFVDKRTGDNLDRPAFQELQAAIFRGDVGTIVLWKLDRLSRNLVEGLNTLAGWCDRGLRVVSVTQQIDFNGALGKMLAAVLLGVAEMEQETRRERQAAGIAAARASGRRWGGSKQGRRISVADEQVDAVRRLRAQEPALPVASLARSVGLSRRTVSRLLAE
jgi:DNA invertase Pin-like site-specific DNA recombinase